MALLLNKQIQKHYISTIELNDITVVYNSTITRLYTVHSHLLYMEVKGNNIYLGINNVRHYKLGFVKCVKPDHMNNLILGQWVQ